MGFRTLTTAGLLLAAALATAPADADEWDNATDPDNGLSTDNALFHGSVQTHDLATQVGPVVDQDWFIVPVQPFSSYEAIVDGQTGDLLLGANQVQLMNAGGTVVLNGSVAENPGSVTLRFGALEGPAVPAYVRVRSPGCGTACNLADRYRIRFYDTTYTIPRFNNAGSQTTVLVVQNATSQACDLTFEYFRGDGNLLTTSLANLPGNGHLVLPTSLLPELVGQSGTIRLVHLCGYDGLSGKAVAIEPSTGFTFDTPLVPRPR